MNVGRKVEKKDLYTDHREDGKKRKEKKKVFFGGGDANFFVLLF